MQHEQGTAEDLIQSCQNFDLELSHSRKLLLFGKNFRQVTD